MCSQKRAYPPSFAARSKSAWARGAHPTGLLDVPPQSFHPAPKVDSAIVRMVPLPASEVLVRDEKLFAEVVAAAFGQRRKTLRNTLRGYLDEADFEKLGIDAQLRAENLGVAEFAEVANLVR